MKFGLFAAVAAGALSLASIAAAAPSSSGETTVLNGYVDADYSYMNIHLSGAGSAGANVWGGKGAVAFPIAGSWGGQIDGVVNDFQAPDSLGGGSQTIVTPSGHAFYRTSQWLAGGFVGAEIAPHLSLVGGGLEGQLYPSNRYTVEGSVAYASPDRGGHEDLWGVRLGGRGFITDNASLNASVNYMNFNGGGYSADLWTEKVGGEYRLDQAPVAITLAYERSDLNKAHLSSDSVLVGIRWTFDGSLHDRDTKGASLPTFTETFGGNTGQSLLAVISGYAGYVF